MNYRYILLRTSGVKEGYSTVISPDRLLIQQQIYNFLRTVTIKYSPIAELLNATLLQKGYEVTEDQETWKYYLNLVGRYHPSDTKMYVMSLDTHESILFAPEVLINHPRTKAVYIPGGSYYNRLCEIYPEQVDLIKSILFPVDNITNAVDAQDLTLLAYSSGYLEKYEESVFIPEIEEFLEILKERWYFDFLDDEPYFYLTFWGSLWTYLAMLLISGRLSHIKTAYVHSWDIWNELQANGLDNYSDILNREKSMMLYQNIDYLKANAGKQSNLVILAQGLLDSFGIGLYGRRVVQESATGADHYQLTPQLVPIRIPKSNESVTAQIEIKTVTTLQSQIVEKGLSPSAASEVVNAIERKLGDTTLNEFATKFLEIRPIAQSKPYAELLNMFLMETLVVSITKGYYTNPVEVYDPLTNFPIFLPPSELLALYHYATYKSMGLDTDSFPEVVRLYRSFTTEVGTPVKTLQHYNSKLYLTQQVDSDAYLANLAYDTDIRDPQDFSTNVTELWLRYMEHILADENTILEKRHFIYEYLSSLCHKRREESVDFVSGYNTYSSWLGPRGIDIESTILVQYNIQANPKEQWANLADRILSTLIPINDILLSFGNFTLSNSGYERLRQLFVQMCSYRVVFLESDRDTSEFGIGTKWSNQYGPDQIESFGDFISSISTSTTDTILLETGLHLHQGIEIDRFTQAQAHCQYTVRLGSEFEDITVNQKMDMPHVGITTSSNMTSQGTLHQIRNAIIPKIINP